MEVEGTGTHWEGGLYNTVKDYDVTYRYANGVVMTHGEENGLGWQRFRAVTSAVVVALTWMEFAPMFPA